MSARAAPNTDGGGQKRGAIAADVNGGPPAKRSTGPTISMTGLQRELQMEMERRCRLEESVEQLRLELQLAGRLLAAAREQFVACGAPQAPHGAVVRTTPKFAAGGVSRAGRSKTDAKLVQRLRGELAESKGQCRRLSQQLESQQQKTQLAAAVKKELLTVVGEMHDYVVHATRS